MESRNWEEQYKNMKAKFPISNFYFLISTFRERLQIEVDTVLAKILVVDDEQYMLKLFEKILTKQGHEVKTAASGIEAIGLLEKNDFDLIFSDLVMPNLDGMDLLKEVKAGYSDIPFIVITAYGTIESAVEAMKTGAFDYLTKPFRKDDILLVTGKALK